MEMGTIIPVKLEENGSSIERGKERLRRILIVDDEERVALTLSRGLRKLSGCEIRTAISGEQCLQLFAEKPFDLLITDYRMPGMDGVALAERVLRLFPDTVVILMTAYNNGDVQRYCRHLAISHILDKPVGLQKIRDLVGEILFEH
jgi:CheY-like chemotaxis protein